ncbi:MAG: HEAT repeat domain-containing protein [Colwellia sp.]|nr:HEAT repeat domain-containing protein [Colwellia sp.]
MNKFKNRLLVFFLVSLIACTEKNKDEGTIDTKKTERLNELNTKRSEEYKMSQLNEAILNMDLSASDIASSMGVRALPELKALLNNEDNAVRTVTVLAIGSLSFPEAYKLLFKALQDKDTTVANTAAQQIDMHKDNISTEVILGSLEGMNEPNALKQMILLLGTRLELSQAELITSYCSPEQDKAVSIGCTAASAKVGVQLYQEQFAKHLLSVEGIELKTAFTLVNYINQPWLLPHLRLLLNNKNEIQSLGDLPLGYPKVLRVCDKAVDSIVRISGVNFSFSTDVHANFSENQLIEVDSFINNYIYKISRF